MTVWAALKWRQVKSAIQLNWTPSVTILKPIKGLDQDAYSNFVSYCNLDYPSDKLQILFGALDADDPVLDIVKRLKAEFPKIDIGIHIAGETSLRGANRKVCNLLNLMSYVKHEYIVLSDSDMRAEQDYLRRILAPFNPKNQAPTHSKTNINTTNNEIKRVGLVTCLYRGGATRSFAAKLEALGIASDFIPSVLVSRALEGVSFALGSTIAIPKSILLQIGGFEPLINQLADDFRIGAEVSKAGYEVVLSDYVIEDVIGDESFKIMLSRRLRWSKTLRVCRPAGYAGAFITHSFALSLIFLCCVGFHSAGWLAVFVTLLIRSSVSLFVTLRCTGDRNVLRCLPLLPLSDCLSFALYVMSYFGNEIVWRGEKFQLFSDGRLEKKLVGVDQKVGGIEIK